MNKILKEIYNIFDFSKMDVHIKKIMKKGIQFSFIILLYSVLFLSIYIHDNSLSYLYLIGSSIFKASSLFITYFLILGISFNKIISNNKSERS